MEYYSLGLYTLAHLQGGIKKGEPVSRHTVHHAQTTASTFEELSDLIKTFREMNPNVEIVFRGQTNDYPLIPSIKRPPPPDYGLTHQQRRPEEWDGYIKNLFLTFGHSHTDDFEEARMGRRAILQHYGYRSNFIDVTRDSEIALWFSRHVFRKKTISIADTRSLHIHYFHSINGVIYRHTENEAGFFYIIGIPESKQSILYDLSAITPKEARRPHAQFACAIMEPAEPLCLNDFVLCKAIIKGGLLRHNRETSVPDCLQLFPRPSSDLVYRSLLTVPYVVSLPNLREHGAISHPVMPFPIYLYSDDDDQTVLEVQNLLYGTSFSALFYPGFYELVNPALLKAKTSIGQTNYRFGDAVPIVFRGNWFPRRSLDFPQQLAVVDINESGWPSNNLYFEIELRADNLPVSLSRRQGLWRGFWVVFENNLVIVRNAIEKNDEVNLSDGILTRVEDEEVRIINHPDNCRCGDVNKHLNDTKLFLSLCHHLKSNALKLVPHHNCPYYEIVSPDFDVRLECCLGRSEG